MEKWPSNKSRNGNACWVTAFEGIGHRVVVNITSSTSLRARKRIWKTFLYSGLPSNGNWISRLAHNCRHLEKLFLTATRVIKDTDLISIGRFCPNLKQLDLLGNSYITSEGCSRYERYLNRELLRLIYYNIFYVGAVCLNNAKTFSYSMSAVVVR